ncbi:hypothetical protein GW931_03455 [archaeon]|nr:hypothetical protein [archaeon]
MKRFIIVLVLAVVLLLGTNVLAQTISLPQDVTDFVKNVAIQKGISENQIKNIEKVDFNNLPEEINIKNIDENNLAMYQINIEDGKSTKPLYVITASQETFKKEVQNFANKMLLNFGLPREVSNSSFLLSGAGVQGSYKKGYVMLRDGSITGISTNLEIKNSYPEGIAEVIIYKNGAALGFRNSINLDKEGSKVDYDLVEEGTVNFEKGDVISTRVLLSDGTEVNDVNTLLEITAKA